MWAGWKKGLLPETNFSREIQRLLNQIDRGSPRAVHVLDEIRATAKPVKAAEARQALLLMRMKLKLEEVSDRSIRAHLRTAALASDSLASASARTHLLQVADPKKKKAMAARYSAQAALDFLRLRHEWDSLI